MTLAEIQKIREEAGEEKPMIIICDNEHHFYDNTGDTCPLIWDDDLERIISFEKQVTHPNTQETLPCKVVYTSYEHIQFIKVLTTVPEIIEILNKFKDKMTEEQYNYCIKFYASSASVHACKPGTYSKEELAAQEAAKKENA